MPGRSTRNGESAALVTPRERQIIQLIAEGHPSTRTATVLGVSVKTVHAHCANVLRRPLPPNAVAGPMPDY